MCTAGVSTRRDQPAAHRDREAVDEQQGGHVATWQQVEKGAKAVDHQADAHGRQDGAKRHLQAAGAGALGAV